MGTFLPLHLSDGAREMLAMLDEAAATVARPDAARSRRARDDHHGNAPAQWQQLADLGWLAATLTEDQGGMGLGLRPAATIARKLGHAARHEPYVAAGVLPLECIAACEGENFALIKAVTEGTQTLAMAWQAQDGRDPAACGVRVAREGEFATLTGSAHFVEVPDADAFIVAALGDAGLELHRVARDTPGVSVRTERAADGSRLARVTFESTRSSSLASGEPAARAFRRAFEAAVLTTAAELLGIMERAQDLTLDYLRTRRQFGKPIGAFQALQHRAVDMWMQVQLTEAALESALNVFDDKSASDDARSIAASSAKARASQAALYVCGQAVQLHGAIGFTDECELGLHVNRAVTLAARYGNAAHHRRRYAELTQKAAT